MDGLPIVCWCADSEQRLCACGSVLRRSAYFRQVQINARLQCVRGLYPFGLVAAVHKIVCPRAAAGPIQIGDGLVEQQKQIVVDLELWIEGGCSRDDGFAVWNAAPVVHAE